MLKAYESQIIDNITSELRMEHRTQLWTTPLLHSGKATRLDSQGALEGMSQ